jgi:predicted phage-related endonuclease
MRIEYPDEQTWRAERRRAIGSSEVPAVLGLAGHGPRRASPLAVALRLLRTESGPDHPETEAMTLGRLFEPVAALWYAKQSGARIYREGSTSRAIVSYFPDDRPWLRSTPDFAIVSDPDFPDFVEDGEGKGEAKYTTLPLGDACPPAWWGQLQHHMLCSVARWGVVSAIDASGRGLELRVWKFRRDDEWLAAAVPALDDFVQRVRDGWIPDADDSDACRVAIVDRYPQHVEGKRIALPEALGALLLRRAELKRRIVADELECARIENAVRLLMGDASEATVPGIDGARVTFRTDKRGVRTLRIPTNL